MSTLTASGKGEIRRVLEAIVGPGGVLSDPDELMVYESDGLTLFRALADFIVFPTSAQQVSAVVKLANRENLPFVARGDRKSTRLNSSHTVISYAVFCLKKKNKYKKQQH